MEIDIIYEDDSLIAVNKPEGIAAIPESNNMAINLYKMLSEKYGRKIYVVHRLDKEVSGIIIFAFNSETHRELNLLFESRNVQKTYKALIIGKPEADEGIINYPLRQFGSGRMGVDHEKGKPSETYYEVLKYYNGHALVKLNPLTGRRHQLRVHMYSIGCPIAGDLKYGNREVQKKYPRLMLHAESIRFDYGGKSYRLRVDLSDSFNRVLENINTNFIL
ncbi:RluA family pseudouridine synthase [Melioribacter sp. OK-6-Me]|uniref:RluA family pseudouridine synthase n=1 Tax=unclassified Melioribacter TaxID=2627329 RepID=UPI003EDB352E